MGLIREGFGPESRGSQFRTVGTIALSPIAAVCNILRGSLIVQVITVLPATCSSSTNFGVSNAKCGTTYLTGKAFHRRRCQYDLEIAPSTSEPSRACSLRTTLGKNDEIK